MTDTTSNIVNDIDLQLAEMLVELEAQTINREAAVSFTVEVFEKVA